MSATDSMVRAPRILLETEPHASGVSTGDFVRLKSGGPLGLVCYAASDGYCDIVWMNDAMDRGSIPAASLVLAARQRSTAIEG